MRTNRTPRIVLPFFVLVFTVLLAPTARLQNTNFTLTIHLTSPVTPSITGAVGVVPIGQVCNGGNGTTCTYQVASGTPLKISGNQPAGGTPAVFSGGTGPASMCDKSTCRFDMTADAEITATFDPDAPKLVMTINLNGEGEVGNDNNRCQNYDHDLSHLPTQFSACATVYAPNSEVTVEGRAQVAGRFVGFSNGTNNASVCAGPAECLFTLSANTSVDATFTALSSIAVTPSTATVSINQTRQFTATGTYANGDIAQINRNLGTWRTKSSMQFARFDAAAAVAGGQLYAIGGISGGGPTSSVERFDPASNAWTSVASLLSARAGMGAATIDGKIYVAGGSIAGACPTDAFDQYDPVNNTWTALTPMPGGARRFLEAVAVGRKIYVLGGEVNDCNTTSGTFLNRVEVFDVDTGLWAPTPPANMPVARRFFGAGVINGIIYAVGGEGVGFGPLSSVDAYNPATNTWSAKPAMPQARGLVAVSVIDNVLYAVGGNNNGYNSSVFAFDPNAPSNNWSNKAFIPTVIAQNTNGPGNGEVMGTRAEAAAASIGGTMYVLGGLVSQDGTHVPFVHAFVDNLIWNTSNAGVATITQLGVATGRSAGATTVRARVGTQTCGDAGGSCATLTVTETVANTPPTVTIFGNPPFMTMVGQNIQLNGSFRDPDLTQTWTASVNWGDGSGDQGTPITPGSNPPASPNGSFSANHVYMTPGNYTATVTVRDSGSPQGVGSASVPIVVQDDNGGGGDECALVRVRISGNNLPFTEIAAQIFDRNTGEVVGEGELPINQTIELEAPEGNFRFEFTAPAGYKVVPQEVPIDVVCGATIDVNATVMADDTTPPTIASVTPSVTTLWPPNNKMVNVSLAVSATDDSGAAPMCSIVGVSANEGSMDDWEFSANSLSLELRAKRSGQGARVYTITVQCTDGSGNSSTKETTVTVPHDQRR